MTTSRSLTGAADAAAWAHLPDPHGQALVSAWGSALEGFADVGRVLAAEMEDGVGIPMSWAEVLFRLRRTPGEELPTTRLARQVSFSSGGFTKLLDRLVEAGFVERRACPTDRRVVYAGLTTRGREVADQALRVHADGLRRHVLAAIGEERMQAVAAAFLLLRDASRGTSASACAT